MSRIYFLTQGCSANQVDSEIMQGLLAEEGHIIVDSSDDADLIIFNTCTVKGPTEAFFKKKLKDFKAQGKEVLIAGCIPQSLKKAEQALLAKEHSLVGNFEIAHIVDAVQQTLTGKTVMFTSKEDAGRLNLPKLRKNKLIEIVPISQGCLNACTFCKTKHARGNLHSYPIVDIVRQVSRAVDSGAKEIWLTSQDNAVYGFDLHPKTTIVELLKAISTIKKDFKIRLGMANPQYVKEYVHELIEVFKDDHLYKFIHIPLQAGSDAVLKAMNRGHTAEDYVFIVNAFRKQIPDMLIATDIICGFPTETDDDFKKTLAMVQQTHPDIINLSKYWPRPGTVAATLKPLLGDVVKKRTLQLQTLFESLAEENNKKWIGWSGSVLLLDAGKNNTLVGRNFNYKQVVVKHIRSSSIQIGDVVTVKITTVGPYDLRGDVV